MLAEIDWESLILPLVGPLFFVIGLAALIRTNWLKARYTKGKGVVVGHKEEWGDNLYYYPIVEFTDPSNNLITFTSGSGSNPKSHQKGDTVDILFNPKKPEKAEIDSSVTLYLLPIIFMIIGVVLGLIILLPKFIG